MSQLIFPVPVMTVRGQFEAKQASHMLLQLQEANCSASLSAKYVGNFNSYSLVLTKKAQKEKATLCL